MTASDSTAERPLVLDAAPAPQPDEIPVPVPTAAPIADGVERSLDPRSVRLARVVAWITAAAVALGTSLALLLVLSLAPLLVWAKGLIAAAWVLFVLALAWLAHRWPEIAYRHAAYKVDEQGIEIRRGVLWRSVVNVPRSRLQHTDVSQGPLERHHGLGTLILYTAGTHHARVDLHGLDHGLALRIRDSLLTGSEDGDAV